MADDFFGLGSLFSPTQPATPAPSAQPDPAVAEREAGWKNVLSNPTLMAGLFNAGVQLMQPRWNPGSALPDALSAGAQTVGKQETEDYQRAQVEETRKTRAAESEADRKNRLETARIGANSRAEVANIRTQAMLDAANMKYNLTTPRTPEEVKFRNKVYLDQKKALAKENENAALLGRPRLSDEEIDRRAAEAADRAYSYEKLKQVPDLGAGTRPQTPTGPGTVPEGPIPGDKTRQNIAPAAPPVGTPGAPQAPNSTRPNTPPNTPAQPTAGITSQEAIRNLTKSVGDRQLRAIFEDEKAYQHLRAKVADPDELDAARKGYLSSKPRK